MKLLLSLLFCIISLAIILQAQISEHPDGEQKENGDEDNCPCVEFIKEGSEVWDINPCGGECAEIKEEIPLEFTNRWYEKDIECASGLRQFSQKTTIVTTMRSTKYEGTYYYELEWGPFPFPGEEDPNEKDCSGCKTLEPVLQDIGCGDYQKYCPQRPEDINEVRREPKKDLGCVDSKT